MLRKQRAKRVARRNRGISNEGTTIDASALHVDTPKTRLLSSPVGDELSDLQVIEARHLVYLEAPQAREFEGRYGLRQQGRVARQAEVPEVRSELLGKLKIKQGRAARDVQALNVGRLED